MSLPSRRRWLRGLGMTVPGLLLASSGCTFGSGPDHRDASAPLAATEADRRALRGSLALVLSTGGPRGFVHVGVLQALDQIGIRPDLVVGASVGALLGTLYCAGLTGKQLRDLAMDLSIGSLARLAIGADETFNGAPIAALVNRQTGQRPLQALQPRCGVVTLDAQTRQPVLFTRGNAGVAVQAATAIEGRFTPVSIRGRRYLDADAVLPMPVRLTRRLGATTVISVDASAHEERAPPEAARFRQGDLRKRANTQADTTAADLNLHPYFGYWVSMKAAFRARAIQAGYEETMRHEKRLLALLANHRARAASVVGGAGFQTEQKVARAQNGQ